MTSPMNRRAALGFLARSTAQASALAVVPAAAFASPVHPDAALFAMQPAIDAADREVDCALGALETVGEAYYDEKPACPEQPEADFSAEERQAIDMLRAASAKRGGPSPAWVAYEQAVQDYEREVERLQAECGETAAQEMQDAAHEAFARVRDTLAETPATTLAGLIFKARYAATHYEDDYDQAVTDSIVDDLLAMADDPGGLADA